MPISEILIAGAGGFGREMLCWISDSIANNPALKIGGFINDDLNALNPFQYDMPIVSTIKDYSPKPNQAVVVAIGDPNAKMSVVKILKDKGSQFFNVIHPSVRINHHVVLGKGIILCPNVIVSNDTVIEDFVTINSYTTIAHDVHIGEGTTISGHCDITGHSKIGKTVFMGSRSGTIPKAVIGDSATVAAGSTVMMKVKTGTTVIGTPAKALFR